MYTAELPANAQKLSFQSSIRGRVFTQKRTIVYPDFASRSTQKAARQTPLTQHSADLKPNAEHGFQKRRQRRELPFLRRVADDLGSGGISVD